MARVNLPHRPLQRTAARRGGFALTAEAALLACSLLWAVLANRPFFRAALADRGLDSFGDWAFAASLFVALAALHFVLLALVTPRFLLKPVLALSIVATAFATHFMQHLGVVLDPSMIRNVLRTDVHEARELFSLSMLPTLALAGVLPLLLLWKLRIVARPVGAAVAWRTGSVVAALALLVGAVLLQFQPLASLMRNQKEVRYLVTPGNIVWSLASVAGLDARAAAGPRQPIGLDAKPGPRMAARGAPGARPLVVVLVVGETARAANWGLNGYARQTTPQLSKMPVVSFTDVTACGTNTETSLPCMFAPIGRRDYDEARIRQQETLLQVVARAGVGVRWRDNQSGCKGVCDGLPNERVRDVVPPGQCDGERCLDEGLLHGLPEWLKAARGTQLLVLHQLGNHGPSYFRRYPPAFERFTPACRNDDLRRCSPEEITNAYDNALLYTDHVLATLIGQLDAAAGDVDSALVYVSDHGESLGEKNLYLHGLPYAIAPDVQKKVPMFTWWSPGYAAASGLDPACVRRRAAEPAAHDHLFHTLLSMLDVQTALHAPDWDLARGCAKAAP